MGNPATLDIIPNTTMVLLRPAGHKICKEMCYLWGKTEKVVISSV